MIDMGVIIAEIWKKLARVDELVKTIEMDQSRESGAGHGQECYYCHEPTNDLHGNPGLWSIPMSHSDDVGRAKWHHMKCIYVRLEATAILEDALTDIACFDDGAANLLLEANDSYEGFADPESVEIARRAIKLFRLAETKFKNA